MPASSIADEGVPQHMGVHPRQRHARSFAEAAEASGGGVPAVRPPFTRPADLANALLAASRQARPSQKATCG
jgi:hypothetical protein